VQSFEKRSEKRMSGSTATDTNSVAILSILFFPRVQKVEASILSSEPGQKSCKSRKLEFEVIPLLWVALNLFGLGLFRDFP
jgi:pyruvate/2-oxoglutarate dehydrogenase complex dihydrolipoamide acyltransferase (E2) component